jgi:hypothetical protein
MTDTSENKGDANSVERNANENASRIIGPQAATVPQQPPTKSKDDHTGRKCGWTNDPGMFVLTLLGLVALIVYTAYTRWLVIDGEESAKRQSRAYVLWSDNQIRLALDETSYTVSMTIKNRGQTPAYSTKYWWDSRVIDLSQEAPRRVQDFIPKAPPTGPATFDIDPQGEWPIELDPRPVTKSTLDAIRNRASAIYVWGKITYTDSFHRCQLVDFLVRNSREIEFPPPQYPQIARWSFEPVAVDNSPPDGLDCVRDSDGIERAKYPW